MSLDIAPTLEAEIEQRAAAEGVSPSQFIDRMLHGELRTYKNGSEQTRERIRAFLAKVATLKDESEPELEPVAADPYGDALVEKLRQMGFKLS